MPLNPAIQYYFKLRATIVLRSIQAFGIHPVIGLMLATAAFSGFSWLLFLRTPYAPYIISLVGGMIVFAHSEERRSTFLLSCFQRKTYRTIRFVENTLTVCPFLVVLLLTKNFLMAGILVIVALLLACYRYQFRARFTLPTPFFARPFEFPAGFRKTLLLFVGNYSLVFIAVAVNNPQIGLVTIGIVFVLCSFFYSAPEPLEFVWIYAMTPTTFLLRKLITGLFYSSICALLPAGVTLVFFPEMIWIVMAIFSIGLLFLGAMILAKYVAIPSETDVQAVLLITFCTTMPPLLLLLIPYLFNRAKKNLQLLNT